MQRIKSTVFEVITSILPITIFVIILQFLLHMPGETLLQFLVGVIFVTAGLIIFLLGVNLGLLPVGEAIGAALPKMGKLWLLIFATVLLGFVITVADPDVRVLATQVDFVSNGAISKTLLVATVSLGIGIYVGLAVLRIVTGIPIKYLFLVSYGLIFVLAAFTPEQFVPISFDSGGVATGPLTVPFVLALGLGIASVLGSKNASDEGFGLLGMAVVGPILAVLILGVIYG
ncbi:MAG: DUF1538 domain-containing protein [Syntrophomonadaceae bacterium]|nr:DUF1538 domain-containing protein [Syntrophomonadaceae bacterium]MDD3888558.1 DUF1538 domain-containing protein [Syntrophomonadaceae bacterium]MDD4548600.1 DUF1538 domain-containing protein [Syntrophomonadaceae bacterium]